MSVARCAGLIILLATFLVACSQRPTATPTPTPATAIHAGTGHFLTAALDARATEAADELLNCVPFDPDTTYERAAHVGIVPGETTPEEILAQFGEPTFASGHEDEGWQEWVFVADEDDPDLDILVQISDEVVTTVKTYPGPHGPTLAEIISDYGCPEVIYLVELLPTLNMEPSGNYNGVELIYRARGLGFQLCCWLFSEGTRPDRIWFLTPSYYDDVWSDKYDNPNFAKQVTWRSFWEQRLR